jgi:hypothetical protein
VISISDNLQGYTVVLMYAFAVCGAIAGITAGTARRRAPAPVAPAGILVGDAMAPLAPPAIELPQPEPDPEAATAEVGRPKPAPRTPLERGRVRLRGLLSGGRRRRRRAGD